MRPAFPRATRLLPAWAVALGCGAPPAGTDPDTGRADTAACRADPVDGSGTAVLRVPTADFPDGVALGLRFEAGEGLLPDGFPVVVVAANGFDPNAVPSATLDLETDRGFVQILVNLPGGGGPHATEGVDDLRGPEARRAFAVAARFAAGLVPDTDGCGIADRLPVPLSALPPLLHGQSNGGNLVFEALADPASDLPPLAAVTTFETPISAQVLTEELGSAMFPQPLYVPGACAWTLEGGLSCPLEPAPLGWDPAVEAPGQPLGAVYFDLDGDGAWTEGTDPPVFGLRPGPEGDRIAFSPELVALIERQGLSNPRFLDAAETAAFWRDRDASRVLGAAAGRWPELPVLAMGTARDHACAAPDHPHVVGLAVGWRAAGGAWIRVNPDAAYMDAIVGEGEPWTDHPANLEASLAGPWLEMEPDESRTGSPMRAYATAGVVEALERAATGTWDPDLDERLTP